MNGEKTCCVCQRPFAPHPRVKGRQKTCAAESCRKELKRRTDRAWRAQNADYFKGRYDTMLKAWHEKNRDYKKRYRQEHPEYVGKNAWYLKVHRQKKKLLMQGG